MNSSAIADRLPQGKRVNIGTPHEMQCYSMDEYKTILGVVVSNNNCVQQSKEKDKKITNLNLRIDSLRGEIVEQDKQLQILSIDAAYWQDRWKEENRLRHEAENKPQWGSWVAWSVAAVAATAAGTAITIAILD